MRMMAFLANKIISFTVFSVVYTATTAAKAQEKAPFMRIVTGGYEAIAADNANKEISGPRTEAVRKFLKNKGVSFKIDTMIWARAYQTTLHNQDTLIYPLTRTAEREQNFEWLHKIDEHHFNLLSHIDLNANSLSKAEITSGKYYAVCEATTSNCHMLLNYGFPDKNIFRVKGHEVDGVMMRLADGRASFMMENYDIVADVMKRLPALQGKIEKVHDVSVVMEDYLAASKLSDEAKQLLLAQ